MRKAKWMLVSDGEHDIYLYLYLYLYISNTSKSKALSFPL